MLARKALGFIGGLVVATGLGTVALQAQTPGLDIDDSNGPPTLFSLSGFNLGYQFSVNTSTMVTALGDFDFNGDGPGSPSNLNDSSDPQLVGLWNSEGDLLASVIVDSSSTQVGNYFAFTSLSTPVVLNTTDVYTVGAQGDDPFYTVLAALNVAPQMDFYQDEFSVVDNPDVLVEPTTSEFGTDPDTGMGITAFLGGNVLLESVAPEPGSFGLLALGFSGTLLLLRRRAIRQAARP